MAEQDNRRYREFFSRKGPGYHKAFKDIKFTDRTAARPDHENDITSYGIYLKREIASETDPVFREARQIELDETTKILNGVQRALCGRNN